MPPRSRSQRQADVLAKLRDDVDLWVASADESGEAYLVPLSFHWDGAELPRGTDPQLEAAFAAAARVQPARGLRLPAHHATRDPGVARGGRARRPPAHARRRLALDG